MGLRRTRARAARDFGCRLLAVILLIGAAPRVCAADGSDWTPAFRIGPAIHIQGLDGSVRSPDSLPFIQGPSGVPDNPATPADEGFNVSPQGAPGDSAQTIEFRFALRLYAPEDLIGGGDRYRPRFFVQVGAERPLDDGFVALRYNQTFNSTAPADYGQPLTAFCPSATAQACAYAARVNVDVLANWSLGFGADFTLPVWEDQFHLTPFVEYVGQAVESDSSFELSLSATGVSDIRRTIRSKSDTELLHGIATGLGFEIDVYQGSWFDLRLFLESRAAWILNDRDIRYDGTNPTPTPNFNTADFMARPSGFIVTTGGGIEIRLRRR